jgi:hypothetical protein
MTTQSSAFGKIIGVDKPHRPSTPKSKVNIELEANRPIDAPYVMRSRFGGFISRRDMGTIKHIGDIQNSKAKRGVVKKVRDHIIW